MSNIAYTGTSGPFFEVPRSHSSEKACNAYFNGDTLASRVYRDKYENVYDSNDPTATPAFLHRRLAKIIAGSMKQYKDALSEEEVFNLLDKFKYLILGGSVMYGLNNPEELVSLSSCWVIGGMYEKDSYGTILRRDEELVQLSKRRGGVGLDLSFLRGKNSKVNNAARTSTGVVPFAARYSHATEEVAQEGRRGALILTLDFRHPDCMNFINAKANTDKITGANISLRIDDVTMQEIARQDAGLLREGNHFDPNQMADDIVAMGRPRRRGANMNFISRPSSVSATMFDELSKNARNFAEPGLIFWDRVMEQIDSTVYPEAFMPEGVNPCGELPLSAYESCRLASLNLYNYVINPFEENAEFNWSLYEEHVEQAQKIMDTIIDLEIGKIDSIIKKLEHEKIAGTGASRRYSIDTNLDVELQLWKRALNKAHAGRRTGLGWTALADVFAALGLRYGSDDSIDLAKNISFVHMRGSYRASIKMAKVRGSFPAYKKEEYGYTANKYIFLLQREIFKDEPETLTTWKTYGRRNLQNIAIAPTGSLSILSQTSSAIEPVYELRYTRRRRTTQEKESKHKIVEDDNGNFWEEYNVIHPKFKAWYALTHSKMISLETIPDKKFASLVEKSPYANSTAYEIPPDSKILLQAGIQKYVDHSISNTLNLPAKTTESQVKDLLMMAWELGLKGISVYRDGSRSGILLKTKEKEHFSSRNATKRPKSLEAEIHMPTIGGTKWIVIVGMLDSKPYEVFAFKNKEEVNWKAVTGPYAVLIELHRVKSGHYRLQYRNTVIVENIVDKFETPDEEFITRLISTSLRHGTPVRYVVEQMTTAKGGITDFHKVISRVLRKYIPEDEVSTDRCPDCSNKLQFVGGCLSCSCGYSKC